MFTISLPNNTKVWEFSKSEFISMFPESMISTALLDPDVEHIDISSPVVTPSILDLLTYIIREKKISSIDEPLDKAHRYLLIDILGFISKYKDFLSQFNILDSTTYTLEHFITILKNGYNDLFVYMIERYSKENDNFFLALATLYGRDIVFDLLISRGATPSIIPGDELRLIEPLTGEHIDNSWFGEYMLDYAIFSGNMNIYNKVYPLQDIDPYYLYTIVQACDNVDVYQLIRDRNISDQDWNNQSYHDLMYYIESSYDKGDIVRYLLQDERLDARGRITYLAEALVARNIPMLNAIVDTLTETMESSDRLIVDLRHKACDDIEYAKILNRLKDKSII